MLRRRKIVSADSLLLQFQPLQPLQPYGPLHLLRRLCRALRVLAWGHVRLPQLR